MNIETTIAEYRQNVKSDSLSMSIGELQGLYERSELDIHPKFQRILRWNPYQKTKLIESILLRIPIPPIFVAQDEEGGWDVVDGMQRLGTIFHFLGILKDNEGKKIEPLELVETTLLPKLDGMTFSPDYSDYCFPKSLRLDLLRSRLDINIILRESDDSAKYELFERLNTGGSIASSQEVRNCVLVWMNENIFDWMMELTNNLNFQSTVTLSSRQEDIAYRTELVLRFISFMDIEVDEIKTIGDISEYLNLVNRDIGTNTDFDFGLYGDAFVETFDLIDRALGIDSFRKYENEKHAGRFLISAFESVALGIAFNIEFWREHSDPVPELKTRIKSMWDKPEFTGYIGTGAATKPRMQKTIPFGREHFAE